MGKIVGIMIAGVGALIVGIGILPITQDQTSGIFLISLGIGQALIGVYS